MTLRRILVLAVVVAMGLTACGGSDGDGAGVSVEEPIGAPDPADDHGRATEPSVVKSASVETEVPRRELSDTAQAVVDVATAPKVGGFLVSSVVDLEEGQGAALVVVEVPATRFEQAVVELSAIGDLTRQEMSGQDLTEDAVAARRRVRRARARLASLRAQLEDAPDEDAADALRLRLRRSRTALRDASRERAYVRSETTYSPIEVALSGKRPPPGPAKPALDRALGTAKAITLGIASGAVIAAGVILPIGLVALVLWLAWTSILRRLRVRWDG